MLVRLSTVAFVAIVVLAFGDPVYAGPGGDFLSHAQSTLRTLIDRLRGETMPEGIAKTNGRIEATQVDVAAKYAGRLESVTVKEGDEVTAGQVIARISSPEYEAQLRAAQAEVLKAKRALAEAEALIAQRKADQILARTDMERGRKLVEEGWLTKQVFDQRVAKADASDADLRAAEAAREQAQFAIETAQAEVERIEAILVDLVLVAPRSGRVQYQIAHGGEVVAAGARVVPILEAGQLVLGDEARIILDPIPQYVIPAKVSFVAAEIPSGAVQTVVPAGPAVFGPSAGLELPAAEGPHNDMDASR
jgi:HlyD family secretion protein